MCLTVPARIVELLPDGAAVVELGGARKRISLDLVADAQPGDYVAVHLGYALQKLDPVDAQRALRLFAEAGFGAAAAPST